MTERAWIPAFAGMTDGDMDPAFAGMTDRNRNDSYRHSGSLLSRNPDTMCRISLLSVNNFEGI